MTTPQDRIEGELRNAMKAGEKARVSTLRMLLNAIKNERIRIGEPVDETGFLGLVRKGIKQRQEAAELYDTGGRQELATKERDEAALLEAYLPPQLGDDEIRAAIEALVAERGLEGSQAMGQVMKAMMERFAGRVDGSTVSRLAREILS